MKKIVLLICGLLIVQAAFATSELDITESKKKKFVFSMIAMYEISQNVAKERPILTNRITLDPALTLPWQVLLSGHIGIVSNYNWNRVDPYGNNANSADIDFEPLYFTFSRSVFSNQRTGLGMTAYFRTYIPYTSRFYGVHDQWYLALRPYVKFYWDFKDFRISNVGGIQKNFHVADAYQTQYDGYNLVTFTFFDYIMLEYSIWKFSFTLMVGIYKDWIYKSSLWGDSYTKLYYVFEIAYQITKQWFLALGLQTYGMDRYSGGFQDDRLYPGHPRYTSFYFDVAFKL